MTIFGKYEGLIKLLFLFAVLPLMAYRLWIGPTVDMVAGYYENRRMLSEMVADTVTYKSHVQTDIATNARMIESGEILHNLMPGISGGGVAIDKYAPCFSSSESGVEICVAELILLGGFTDMLRIVRYIEDNPSLGSPVSICFYAVRPQGRNPGSLKASMLIRHVTGK